MNDIYKLIIDRFLFELEFSFQNKSRPSNPFIPLNLILIFLICHLIYSSSVCSFPRNHQNHPWLSVHTIINIIPPPQNIKPPTAHKAISKPFVSVYCFNLTTPSTAHKANFSFLRPRRGGWATLTTQTLFTDRQPRTMARKDQQSD